MTPPSRPGRVIVTQAPPVLRLIRGRTSDHAGFPDPRDLIESAGLTLVPADLPGRTTELVSATEIWYRWSTCQRERGTAMFRGLARAIIGPRRCTPGEVSALAGRLAAPPSAVRRVGIEAAIQAQAWATEDFLRAWCASYDDVGKRQS